jgi:hypothetical protein
LAAEGGELQAAMSTSSLSDLDDVVFDSPRPPPSKRRRLDQPSKQVKLSYGKQNRQLVHQVLRNVSRIAVQQRATQPPSHFNNRLTGSPQGKPPIPTTVIPTLELQHLRQNNAFLRRSNVELARSQSAAQAQLQAAGQAAREAREEVAKLKRHEEIRSAIDSGELDSAKRLQELEEYRKLYWECGIQWAKIEKRLEAEKQLLKREVSGLMERVRELEGRILDGHRERVMSPRKENELSMVMGRGNRHLAMDMSNHGMLIGLGMSDVAAEEDVADNGQEEGIEEQNLVGVPVGMQETSTEAEGATVWQQFPGFINAMPGPSYNMMRLPQHNGLGIQQQHPPSYNSFELPAFAPNAGSMCHPGFSNGGPAYESGWDDSGNTAPQPDYSRFDPEDNGTAVVRKEYGVWKTEKMERWSEIE